MYKTCSMCEKLLSIELFKRYKKRGKYYIQSFCKKCRYLRYKEANKAKAYLRAKRYQEKLKLRMGVKVPNIIPFSLMTLRRIGAQTAVLVYNRANGKCEICNTPNNLTFEHIDGQGRHFLERGLPMNNDPSNLRILCRSCHGRISARARSPKIKSY